MEKKKRFLKYILALIPGVGYLYYGLKRRGIEAFLIWVLIEPILGIFGLHELDVLKTVFWVFIFFDTINVIERIERGEYVPDHDFWVFSKIKEHSNEEGKFSFSNKGFWYITGWILVVFGVIAIGERVLIDLNVYYLIKGMVSKYFIPIFLVGVGIYILFKNKDYKSN